MTQLVIIGMVIALVAHDALRGATAASPTQPAWSPTPGPNAVWWTLTAYAVIALATHLWVWRCARALDRTGNVAYLWSARSLTSTARLATLLIFASSLFLLAWLDRVRETLGDWVILDEIIAMSPALGVIFLGYWSYGIIDRRLREASIFASVERGEVIHPPRPAWSYMTDQVRHQVLFLLVPMWMVLAWVEAVGIGAAWLAPRGAGWLETGTGSLVIGVIDASGALAVFALAPPIVRRIWKTERLGRGELRSRLEELCARHGVRHRGILLWRTHGTMINGAVMGLLPGLRYILLTDLLLERLDDREVEAVMAHELGHIVRRHVPWLLGGMAASLSLSALIAGWAGSAVAIFLGADGPIAQIVDVSAALLGILIGLELVGRISRMFEREADAFAVQHLAGMRTGGSGKGALITEEAADGMRAALLAVARENHIPLAKWTWRHGSLSGRISRIGELVGKRVGSLDIDRAANRVRWWIVLALALVGLASVLNSSGIL
ncbi:MAG: M48 family metalloprotease [Phycisphaerales bacterium]